MDEIPYKILQTTEYQDWIRQESPRSQVQVNKRLAMIKFEGHFGDYKSVSFYDKGELKDKIWELRWKDGRRIYYASIHVLLETWTLCFMKGLGFERSKCGPYYKYEPFSVFQLQSFHFA